MASLSYATPGTGVIAVALGWINFGNLTLYAGQTLSGVTATLLDGSTLTFDITNTDISGNKVPFKASQPPVFPQAPFGAIGYTGIVGNVVMYTSGGGKANSTLTLSNIKVIDPSGNPVKNYTFYVVDAESTNLVPNGESQTWTTNGGNWKIVEIIGTGPSPALSGVGTQTATLEGVLGGINAPVLSTLNPTQISTNINISIGGLEGVAFGISITKVKMRKVVNLRLNPTDQFQLSIAGTPGASATTTGNSLGLQSVTADSYSETGGTFTLSESMVSGSGSILGQYFTSVTYINATPGGSTPPPDGTFPKTLNLALGDDITAIVTNSPNAPIVQVDKGVDSVTTFVGGTITYIIIFTNNAKTDANNVIVKDPIPAGTAYLIGSVSANVPITGDPTTVITLTNSVKPGQTVTVSYQVLVTTFPNPNPIPSTANITYNYILAVGQPQVSANIFSNTVTTKVLESSRGVLFI